MVVCCCLPSYPIFPIAVKPWVEPFSNSLGFFLLCVTSKIPKRYLFTDRIVTQQSYKEESIAYPLHKLVALFAHYSLSFYPRFNSNSPHPKPIGLEGIIFGDYSYFLGRGQGD